MRRFFVVSLTSLAVLDAPHARAQTLDELQRPLLERNQVTADIDYGQFAVEREVLDVGGSYSYFEPTQHTLVSGVGLGLSKRAQLGVSGTYLPPVQRPFSLFGDRSSILDSRLMVRSLRAELVTRPTDTVEVGVAFMSGRSRYTADFPSGPGTSSAERQGTEILEMRGIWLPQADLMNRALRADLDGLTGPLLRRRRAILRWNALWRRYRDTANDHTPGSTDAVEYEIHSTDTRVRVGAGVGVTDRFQVATDGYWQPPFTVTDLTEVARRGVSEHADDSSDRFTGVFGWRADTRWRPVPRIELFGGAKIERQSLHDAAAVAPAPHHGFRQTGIDSGVIWLSRGPQRSAPWQADVSGLHRPLLESRQLRVDAIVHLRTDDESGWHARATIWRVRAAVGVLSSFQAAVYAGRFVNGGDADAKGNAVGADLRFRPARRLEAFATFDYHPQTWLDRYPAFILDRGSFLRSFRDFTDTSYRDLASVHIGLRLVL
jgi:hypothetical protein